MLTRDDGYGAIGATAVAALANLDISIVTRGGDMALPVAEGHLPFAEVAQQFLVVEFAVILIYLWYLLFQLFLVSL